MKVTAAATTVLVSLVVFIAVVLGGGDSPPLYACGTVTTARQLDAILGTIRTVETGGRYDTRIASSSASGAYAFIDSTWRTYADLAGVDTETFPSAWMASAADQDAAAAADVQQILSDHGNRVETVPLAWYWPMAIDNPDQMDVIPRPDAGNNLTPRQYQAKWMTEYDHQVQLAGDTADAPAPSGDPVPATPTPGGCSGTATSRIDDDWALPGPRALLDANPSAIKQPHHDYAAWDWLVPLNTPIFAIHAGVVRTIHTWPYNWWRQGCTQAAPGGCDTCGVGLTIVDANGTHWTYCHGTNLTVRLGDTVSAGEQIMWSGDNGRSGAPHVHVEIRTNGTRRCPQSLIAALYYDDHGLDPTTLPTTGCSF